jgi:hypothetical protein
VASADGSMAISASASVKGGLLEVNLRHELIRVVSGRRSKIEHDNENEHDNDFGPSGRLTLAPTLPPPAALAEEGSLSDVLRFD